MRYRKEKMQDLMREEISSIIQKEIKDPGLGFITIIEVKMTEDLKFAKALYSVYGSDEERENTVVALRRAKGYIKHLIGERIKLRYTPDISFVLDTGQEKLQRINEILHKVRVSDVHED